MLFGRGRQNFRINFIASFNSVGNRLTFALQETCLHGNFHLAWADDACTNHPLRTQVANIDLLAGGAVRQGLARHAYAHSGAASTDDDLITAPYDLCDLQMAGSQNLITAQLARQFLADRLRGVRQEVLTERPDVAFHHAQICRLDHAHALEGTGHHDDLPVQAYFSRHEHGPGGSAVAAYSRGHTAQRLRRALQRCGQWSIAQRQTQPGVEPIDTNFMAALNFATL